MPRRNLYRYALEMLETTNVFEGLVPSTINSTPTDAKERQKKRRKNFFQKRISWCSGKLYKRGIFK